MSWRAHTTPHSASAVKGVFATGQSVLHWWANWFAPAKVPQMRVAKKSRPAWYDATIIAALPPKEIMYAGHKWTEPVYQVH